MFPNVCVEHVSDGRDGKTKGISLEYNTQPKYWYSLNCADYSFIVF